MLGKLLDSFNALLMYILTLWLTPSFVCTLTSVVYLCLVSLCYFSQLLSMSLSPRVVTLNAYCLCFSFSVSLYLIRLQSLCECVCVWVSYARGVQLSRLWSRFLAERRLVVFPAKINEREKRGKDKRERERERMCERGPVGDERTRLWPREQKGQWPKGKVPNICFFLSLSLCGHLTVFFESIEFLIL